MTKKYTSPEEDEEIKRLYRTGKYTYKALGEMFHISKSTIINIVKSYPYTVDKLEFWRRCYRDMSVNMDKILKDIRDGIMHSLIKHDNITYSVLMRQERYLLGLADIPPEELFQTLRRERTELERSGWGHFAKEDYVEFSYCQSLWRKVNYIIGDNQKNPWGELPERAGAKSRAYSLKPYSRDGSRLFSEHSQNVPKNGLKISDNLYNELISYVLANTGRPINNPRQRLENILNLIYSGESPQKHKNWQKIYESYGSWYRSGVFRVMWELNEKYPELVPVRAALLFIERHRMIDPDKAPKFKDVQNANRKEERGSETS